MDDAIDLEAALTVARKAGLTIGFNGWGMASLNHLHLHLFPEGLLNENLPFAPERNLGDVSVGTLQGDLVGPIVLKGREIPETVSATERLITNLLGNEIQHGVLLTPDQTVTTYAMTSDLSKDTIAILGQRLPVFGGIPFVVNEALWETMTPDLFVAGMQGIRPDREALLTRFFDEETSRGHLWARDGGLHAVPAARSYRETIFQPVTVSSP